MNEDEKIPFPTEEWFGERELDEKLHIFEYQVNDVPKKVAFWIKSLSHEKVALITAEHSEKNELGLDIPDQDAIQEGMVLEATSYELDGKRVALTESQLMMMKANKKNGLYNQLVFAVAEQSEAKKQKEIDEQKN